MNIMSPSQLRNEGMTRVWEGGPGCEIDIMYSMINKAYEEGRRLGRAQMTEEANQQLGRLICDEELEYRQLKGDY